MIAIRTVLVILAILCTTPVQAREAIAITNINVVPMNRDRVLPRQTVLAHLQRPLAVMQNGRWLDAQALQGLREEVVDAYRSADLLIRDSFPARRSVSPTAGQSCWR